MRAITRIILLAPFAFGGAASASTTLPPMKPGLWMGSVIMHMNMAGQPPDTDNTPMVRYNCMDAASMAAEMSAMSGAMPGCAIDIEGGSGTYTMTINCKNPSGMAGSINGVTTLVTAGDTEVHFTGKTTSDIQGMKMTGDDTGEDKWVGDCPAGIVPGDYGTMENGTFHKEGNSLTKP